MRRDLKRVYRQHGIKYLALPALIVLLIATVADQYVGGYFDHREEAAGLQARRDQQNEILALDARIRRNQAALEPTFGPLQSQVHVAPDSAQAMAAMQAQLRELLQSLYFDGIEFFDPAASPAGQATRLSVSARFQGVPQQLPRLQAALARNAFLVGIDSLQIRVVDDAARGGHQLAFTLRLTGLHMKPLASPASPAVKPANGQARI